jgi:HD-like signal output (HDOD) protein
LPERIHDPVIAFQQLGMNTVRSLVLSSHVFANLKSSSLKNFSADSLWCHLMKCGHSARAIMRAEDAELTDVEDAFTAGILHDMGKLMLADSLPDEFQKALSLAAERQVPLFEAEMEIFGTTHAGLAAYLLGLWGLPAAIVEAVAFHHTPEKSTNPHFSPLTAVHVANGLEHELAGENFNVDHDYVAKIGVANRLDEWRSEVEKSSEAKA